MTQKFLSHEEDAPTIDHSVKSFHPPDLAKLIEVKSHKQIKSTFKENLTKKDAQFRLSEHVSNMLSVEEEDQKKFEITVTHEVEKRLQFITEATQKKGYEDGYGLGKKEGYEGESKRLKEMEDKIGALFETITGMTPKIFASHEAVIMEFIAHFASLIARREVSLNKDYLSSVLREIVERCGATEGIKIWLNKEDYKVFEEIKVKISSHFGGLRGLAFEPDDAIELGGCRVETEFGEMKTSLTQQLKALEKSILDKVPKIDGLPT